MSEKNIENCGRKSTSHSQRSWENYQIRNTTRFGRNFLIGTGTRLPLSTLLLVHQLYLHCHQHRHHQQLQNYIYLGSDYYAYKGNIR